MTDGRIEVKKIDQPAMGAEPSGQLLERNVYQYVEVVQERIVDEIEYVNIGFRVEKSWIKENNIDPFLVKLFRFSDGWNEMDTSYVGESQKYAYYESTIPGFSIFAIAGSILEETGATCIPYDKKCDGKSLMECNMYGDRWELMSVCENYCVDDECQEAEVTKEQEDFGYAIFLVIIIIIFFVIASVFAYRHRRSVDQLTGYGTYS